MKEIKVWGIKINPLSKVEIVDLVDKHITNKNCTFHLTGVNPETIAQAQKNDDLKTSINSSDIVNVDNMLVLFLLKLMGNKIPERAACPDLFEKLLSLSNQKGYTVFFLGAKQEILQQMMNKLKLKYPKLSVVGFKNGYYDSQDEKSIVSRIKNLKPDMLFIAFPTPQKELFINRYKNELGVRFAFGVGGAFDVQAGKVRRAPRWMRNIGLEGFHRAMQNPKNYGSRYIKYYLPFLRIFLKEFLLKNAIKKRSSKTF